MNATAQGYILNSFNNLLKTAISIPLYKHKYSKLGRFFPLTKISDIEKIPTLTREEFYNYPISKSTAYLMKSRADINGNEPIVPLTAKDYREMVHFEAYKFYKAGVRKGQRVSIPATIFTLNHTIPMVEALMELETKYIVLEGPENKIFEDIVKYKIDFIFTTIFHLNKFIQFVQDNRIKTNLKTVMTAGEPVMDLAEQQSIVKKVLNAQFIDSIGARELGGFTITCKNNSNYHVLDKYQYAEVINPYTGEINNEGELIVTPFWRKDLPLIRYRTGDYIKKSINFNCYCHINNVLTFGKIIKHLNKLEKVGISYMPLDSLYNIANSALLYQIRIFDKFIWKFIQKPKTKLIITKKRGDDYFNFLIEEKIFYFTLRRRSPILKLVIEKANIIVNIVLTKKALLNDVQNNDVIIDLRHQNVDNVPKQLRNLLTELRLI